MLGLLVEILVALLMFLALVVLADLEEEKAAKLTPLPELTVDLTAVRHLAAEPGREQPHENLEMMPESYMPAVAAVDQVSPVELQHMEELVAPAVAEKVQIPDTVVVQQERLIQAAVEAAVELVAPVDPVDPESSLSAMHGRWHKWQNPWCRFLVGL